MARFLKKRDKSIGLPPGSMVFVGTQKEEKVRIRLIDYSPETLIEEELNDLSDIEKYMSGKSVTWMNIDGLHNTELMESLSSKLSLHPLMMEDVLNTGQRSKMDEYDNCIYLVAKMLMYDEKRQKVSADQISLILSDSYCITFQELKGDNFDPLRERIRKQKGRIRKRTTDYLAYSILDIIIDNYIRIVELIGEQIEDLEKDILDDPGKNVTEKIISFKQEINFLSKSIRPVRELVLNLIKSENSILKDKTKPFLKDLEDHIIIAIESLETYREMLNDYLNLYNTNISNKMNDVMRVLTIFASIFIPLTFIAGIYGMNFEFMPELKFKYGYFTLLGIMMILGIIMLIIFRRKKWL